MYEKRLTQRLTSYWEKLKKEEEMPSFQTFNPSIIDDVWDYCMLLAVNDNSQNASYSYSRLGEKVRSLYDNDVSGQAFRPTQKTSQSANIVKRVGELIEKHEPLYDNGQFISPRNKMVKFRSCMLPFGQNGSVTHIIVGLSWREFG